MLDPQGYKPNEIKQNSGAPTNRSPTCPYFHAGFQEKPDHALASVPRFELRLLPQGQVSAPELTGSHLFSMTSGTEGPSVSHYGGHWPLHVLLFASCFPIPLRYQGRSGPTSGRHRLCGPWSCPGGPLQQVILNYKTFPALLMSLNISFLPLFCDLLPACSKQAY